MLADGSLTMADIEQEIRLGFFRPSLLWDIVVRPLVPKVLWPVCDVINTWKDGLKRYQPHREVYLAKKRRALAEKNQAKQLA